MRLHIRPNQRGAPALVDACRRYFSGHSLCPRALGVGLVLALAQTAWADDLPRQAGGLVAYPVITSLTTATQNVILNWSGFAAPYVVEQFTPGSTSAWSVVYGPTNTHSLTLPQSDMGIFRVGGKSPNYAGASVCADCHSDAHADWTGTLHSHAFEALKTAHADKNPSCIVCHTVGYGMPSGFIDEATTPQLAGVQCENCHGPAGDHANKPNVMANRPPKVLSANLCGGCHTGAHNPNWDEWATSGHAAVVPDVASSLLTGGTARMNSCGVCHSGAVRVAKLTQYDDDPLAPLPSAQDAANTGVTCQVCHDPHAESGNTYQLRAPMASMIPFSYSTATNTSFLAQYNDQVNACGQCHNMRGAAWTDTTRPPHHSPQYNMLIGNGGYEVGTPSQSDHRSIDTQCAHCHMERETVQNPSAQYPNSNGHSFQVKYTACDPCHTADEASNFATAIQADTQQRVATLKGLLDTWATTKAPADLQAKYGALAWEYTNPGDLSNPTGASTTTGPTTAEQAKLPNEIKQARFNLYLVHYDQSDGVHNGRYARYLLKVGQTKVQALLAQ